MVQLALNEEQARLIRDAAGPIEVVDLQGQRIGVLERDWSAEELAEAEALADSDGPWYTTAEVLAHLHSIDVK